MRKRLAIIDDSEELREMLRMRILLEHAGIDIQCFANPRDFLFQIKDRPGLVISDYCFGHITLDFFWQHMKQHNVVIYSGSVKAAELPCPFVDKTKTERLLKIVHDFVLSA